MYKEPLYIGYIYSDCHNVLWTTYQILIKLYNLDSLICACNSRICKMYSKFRFIFHIKTQGLKAIEAVNKFQWKTKEPLNMFRVSFVSTEDVKKIYGIKHVLNTVVQVEPFHWLDVSPTMQKLLIICTQEKLL